MDRSLRATIAIAVFSAVAGLFISSEATASGAKPPVATDFSSVVKKSTVVVKKTVIIKKTVVAPKKAFVAPKKVFVAPKKVFVTPKKVFVAPKKVIVGPVGVVGPKKTIWRGPRHITGPLILGGRRVTVIRGQRSVFWRGRSRYLVPLAALGVITVGAVSYRAYGYVPVEEPVCTGQTPDGCELRWQEVATPEGDLIPQCVQFCPPEP